MEIFNIDENIKVVYENNDWLLIENGINQTSTPKSIYKYFSVNEFSIDGLKNNYLYLNNPMHFNDPFDCNRNLIFENQKLLNNWDYVETLNNVSNIGIASFSEEGMEPLLWSHYADSYKGFCIKFNVELLFKEKFENLLFKKVIYSKKPNCISINHDFSKYYQYLLKLYNWKYEKEWRILVKDSNNQENRFYFDSKCIEEISIGYKFKNNKNNLTNLLMEVIGEKFKNTPFMNVGPHQTNLILEKLELKYGTVDDAFEMFNYKFG